MLRKLWSELDFKLSEILQLDFLIGVLGAIGSVTIAIKAPKAIIQSVPIVSSLVGVIIGAVIAGAALQAAFLDQAFLRKIRAIGREPVRYIAPFLFTAVLGVFASLLLIAASTLSAESATPVLAVIFGLAGFFSLWAIASLLPCLSTLVQFIHLKMDAIDVDDDIDRKK